MTKKLVYDVPSWHDTLYHNVKNTVGRLTEVIGQAQEHYKEYDKFAGELFSRMYSSDGIRRLKDVPYWNEWAETAHGIVDELPEMDVLRSQVEYDQMLSAFAAATVAGSVYERLPHEGETQDLEELENQLQGCEDMRSMLDPDSDTSVLDEAQQQIQEMIDEAKSKMPKLEQSTKQSMRSGIREAIKQASEEVEAVSAAVKVCGMDSASLAKDDNKRFIKLATAMHNDKHLQELIKLAGKLINMYTSMKRKSPFYARTELSGITMGNHIERALMSEMVPEEIFAYKFITNSLLEHEIKSREDMTRGPVVVCIDMSGSMSGEPELMAKAIALAIYNRLKAENRTMAACLFNYDVVQELHEDNILGFLLHRANGGTRIGAALNWALKKINEQPDADLILITDGGVEDVTEYKQRLEGIDVLSILISGSDYDAAKLQPISTQLIRTSRLSAESIFRKII
jgi:uncharacterized protein with von Willebrand factor type A (vWA) domain